MAFSGDVAIVTGASSGIGKAAALKLAEQGAKVVLCARRLSVMEEMAEEIKSKGFEASAFACDVSKAGDVEAAVAFAEKTYGKLTLAFNNAGGPGPQALLADIEVSDYLSTIDTNLNSIFFCMKYEIAAMLRAGGGSIVNTSSILGLVGTHLASPYCATKFGIVGLTKAAAAGYAAKNIRVNCIHPGYIKTPLLEQLDESTLAEMTALHPQGRLGTESEVAEAVLWLLSDKSTFTNGSSLLIDGGYTAV